MPASFASFAPVLVAGVSRAVAITADGEIVEMPPREMARQLGLGRGRTAEPDAPPPVLCHGPATARRLGVGAFPARDILELYAFVCPARFCLPTPRGVAEALNIPVAPGLMAEAEALQTAAQHLLGHLAALDGEPAREALDIARVMARGGWTWGPEVLAALGTTEPTSNAPQGPLGGLRVWTKLREWQDEPPLPPPASLPVSPEEARDRLADLVAMGGGGAQEARPQQVAYAAAATEAFAPRNMQGAPRVVLGEAGTGVGKTLGYIAPASLWAEKNQGAVWLSTYTRNLQRQLDNELDRLYPDPAEKAGRIVIRKGRENYLCLLNLEEHVNRAALNVREAISAGLMARWARATRDGDMVGGDFPAWLSHLIGYAPTLGLADRRGECVYSACDHWRKCFVEKTIRRARKADIVVANHALVMAQAALAGLDDANVPTRYVFDEGHHLFDAADSAFSAHLGGRETAEMRRWLLGAETEGGRRASRARGLQKRIGDLLAGDEEATELLDAALRAAKALPGEGWAKRLSDGLPKGATESFLALVRQQVLARAADAEAGYSLEAEKIPLVDGLAAAAEILDDALTSLQTPLAKIGARLARILDERADELDTATRQRIEGALKSLERRAAIPLAAWRSMLAMIDDDTPPDFVDWFSVERMEGREIDVGLHRHWVDPTVPFARDVLGNAHGALITSATLRDAAPARAGQTEEKAEPNEAWQGAESRTGARHLPIPAGRFSVPSPFDYPACTRVIVVTDVAKANPAAVAAATRSLFLASSGGAIGLFTSIARLRDVHARIAPALEDAGITLLSQHVDGLDTATLVDIFRAEEDSCLLGTDAVRDGVDVPGRSLRLIVFDRVPWPRPDILHKARRQAFGGKAWDETITRLKLKQAYGRLIRRAGDSGVFVMLDSALPSRLTTAFPPGVEIRRMGLAQACNDIREFFGTNPEQIEQRL